MSKGGRGGSYRSSRSRSSRYRAAGGHHHGNSYHDGNWDTVDIIGLIVEIVIGLIGIIVISYCIWKYLCRAKHEDDDEENEENKNKKQQEDSVSSDPAVEGSRYGPEHYSQTAAIAEYPPPQIKNDSFTRTGGNHILVTENIGQALEGTSFNRPEYYLDGCPVDRRYDNDLLEPLNHTNRIAVSERKRVHYTAPEYCSEFNAAQQEGYQDGSTERSSLFSTRNSNKCSGGSSLWDRHG